MCVKAFIYLSYKGDSINVWQYQCFKTSLNALVFSLIKTFTLSFAFGMEWWWWWGGLGYLKDFFKLIELAIVWYYTNPQSFLLPWTGQKNYGRWLVVVVVGVYTCISVQLGLWPSRTMQKSVWQYHYWTVSLYDSSTVRKSHCMTIPVNIFGRSYAKPRRRLSYLSLIYL